MKDEHLLEEQELAAAFRDVRETYDGTNPEASVTLHRALFRTRKQASRQRFTRYGLIPIAAVLAASTAWAGVTGKLAPVLHSVLETLHMESPRAVEVPAPVAATAAPAPSVDPPSPAVEPPSPDPSTSRSASGSTSGSTSASGSTSRSGSTSASGSTSRSTSRSGANSAVVEPAKRSALVEAEAPRVETTPALTASAPDPHAPLFAEAHRIHFVERDPARALAAWDRYLAVAPDGRFAPEARYNRALSLVRLGRTDEAKPELEAFARGSYGNYRREEAKALLDALGR